MTKYATELREQVVKEIAEVGSIAAVCKKHGLNPKTVHHWVHAAKNGPAIKEAQTIKQLRKQLFEKEMENKVLKELLKKTVQVLSNDEK
jgi:transposase-like protein